MAVKFDPILGKLRAKDIIPELSADPASPKLQDAWVLHTQTGGGGTGGGKLKTALGFGGGGYLVTVGSGGSVTHTYQFSYRTVEGTTKRVTLS